MLIFRNLNTNKSKCHYCDNMYNKKELTTYFNCNCLFCINCRDNIKEQLLKIFAYEYYINQYFDHILINIDCICPLCCSNTDYYKFTKHLTHKIVNKHTKKYIQIY